ncbi:MAG: RAD55 family ATPase [Thermoplasmata archaeon]|nr:RAD55 family ATPase [Thermoplasmata archaeon]
MNSVPTGVENLDSALISGIPIGYTVLLSGTPGSGIELFAKQFIGSHLPEEDATYITTTEKTEDIINTMKDFNWKTDIKIVNLGEEFYRRVLEKEIFISKYREEGIPASEILRPHKFHIEKELDILTLLTYEISMLKSPFRLVLDSLDFLFSNEENSRVISTLRTIKSHTQYRQGVSLFTLVTTLYPSIVQSGVEEIVDIILTMENIRTQTGFDRIFTIKKFRNHPEKVGIFKYNFSKNGIIIQKIF